MNQLNQLNQLNQKYIHITTNEITTLFYYIEHYRREREKGTKSKESILKFIINDLIDLKKSSHINLSKEFRLILNYVISIRFDLRTVSGLQFKYNRLTRFMVDRLNFNANTSSKEYLNELLNYTLENTERTEFKTMINIILNY